MLRWRIIGGKFNLGKIILNVKEYGEGMEVELDIYEGKLCVVAYNECGHNSTWIDAEQLYKELKNYFEKD